MGLCVWFAWFVCFVVVCAVVCLCLFIVGYMFVCGVFAFVFVCLFHCLCLCDCTYGVFACLFV